MININVTDTRNKVNLRFIKLETVCELKEKKGRKTFLPCHSEKQEHPLTSLELQMPR